MILLFCGVAAIWIIGAVHLWQRQSQSAALVSVNWTDRLIAFLWLPLFLPFFIVTLLASARQPRKRL
ncbi:hypothetical protein [Sphingobium mellinum]|uniref:hypothetical protein n=1 Tax=Sphingobium mellinum TaxID=1387166 RepID=UPI0030EE535A